MCSQQQATSWTTTMKWGVGSTTLCGRVAPGVLRIRPQYQLSGLSPADARRVTQQLVPAAIKVLQRYIKVLRPAGGVLRVAAYYADGQQGCLISKVDGALASGAGGLADTDLLLYVSSEAASCMPGMIAMATACDVDPASGRPILGSLNVCGGALAGLGGLAGGSEAEASAVGRLVEVLVHEVVHVLGFGSSHYDDWRGPDGKRYGERNVVKTVGGRPYLATPKVTAVARQYFGCASLPGAPLEDEGPSFSATSHFEYRLLQRELMGPARPIDRSRTRLSAFTLAALEDTGWYVANYSSAEVLDWGRGAGCAFVLQSCWDYMAATPGQPYFCGKGAVNQTRCTPQAAGWGVCRSSAFSDGCLLVGKYSSGGAAAVPQPASRPSSEDGRQAACYSPPQLQRLQLMARGSNSGGGGGSSSRPPALLPLLGGSYSAARSDVCYNLVAPQPQRSSVVWVDGHGQIPEDAALSAQGASLLASLAGSSAASAACTASPVLCFSSNCDRQGRLWIGASLPGGRRLSFACPSRSVVDLSRALPGSYLLGFLQCPSNALVCEALGCSGCSASGGYCSRGRCYCHMERYGKGCSQSLVPRLR
ncbi:hypothetical protein OEZ85_010035 [Tetradesmus obliquus]|uniref:Leishmanolysin-like peptidase n=1 Tax=Tetradesmus obliquus TaxID=3088 RepID=A0ABY8UB32_TETOB|nr:hypothetical protein OEZ85_010035 [Tetradesmus obliquus]